MNRAAARATLQILSTRARQRPKLGMPGQRSSATPTRLAYENERMLRFRTLCCTLAGLPEWPSSIASRSARMSEEQAARAPCCAWHAAAGACIWDD